MRLWQKIPSSTSRDVSYSQTSVLVGTFFGVSYSKPALGISVHCAIGRSLDERLIFVAIVNELFIYRIGSSRFFVTFVVVVCLENMSSGTQQKKAE